LFFALLTKSGGLLGPIASLLGLIMNGIYEFFSLFGIQNIALSIIVFTFITRALMLPLTIKQQKFTKLSSKMNPELQKITAKYKGKKDEVSLRKQQAETQAIYEKYGASPTAGCLPLLISLPVMLALYQVINNIPAYVGKVKVLYEGLATQISNTSGYETIFQTLTKGLRLSSTDFTKTNSIISALAKFKSEQWKDLIASFPQLTDIINSTVKGANNVNKFLNIYITDIPFNIIKEGFTKEGSLLKIIITLLIPIFAAVLSYVQSKQLQSNNKDANKDNPAASAMNSMNVVMPIMQLFFCFTFPVGIGIYWIATSVFTIIQQYFVNKYLDRISVDDLIEKNLEKATKRKAYAESKGVSLEELAKRQTKSIESIAAGKNNKRTEEIVEQEENESMEADNNKTSQSLTGPKSITDIANLLKNREKGDK
jgi:YidC/Oxa1 family membrane protein insertase